MSTRATYKITEISSQGRYSQCFYIHYDGYPEGAVSYFHDFSINLDSLIKDGRYRCGKAISAFGMLPFSEFTESHEAHGDAEYRYNLRYYQQEDKWYLSAWATKFGVNDETCWYQFFTGTLQEFIEKYKQGKDQ